jgi:hypothetical protein
MPCSDSSSGLNIRLTLDERLHSYEFAKITCARPIGAATGLAELCAGKTPDEIMAFEFAGVRETLGWQDSDEPGFILQLELDALKAGIAQYLGLPDLRPDADRYLVSAVEHGEQFIDIDIVILPPKDKPATQSCRSMACGV